MTFRPAARARLAGALLAAAALAGCTTPASPAAPPPPTANPSTARSTTSATPSASPTPLSPPALTPGSDPSVLPGPVLIADKLNNRLIVVDPEGRILWEFPRPGDLAPGQTFLIPDDAFYTADGKEIVATQEDDFAISVIDVATHRIVYRYGTAGIHGSGPNQLWNPDDALLLPGGTLLSSDIKNCRILLIAAGAHTVQRQLGTTGSCVHNPPSQFGSPNGAFPMADGNYLITEINGAWVDAMSLAGHVAWSTHPPGVAYPSDTNEIGPNRYLTVDYSEPGQIVVFTSAGQLLWRFRPGGADALNHPSLALPLPNGDVLANDDFNHRVIVVDPRTDRIVWQYGHTGIAGSGPGYLNNPDGVDLLGPNALVASHAATMGKP